MSRILHPRPAFAGENATWHRTLREFMEWAPWTWLREPGGSQLTSQACGVLVCRSGGFRKLCKHGVSGGEPIHPIADLVGDGDILGGIDLGT